MPDTLMLPFQRPSDAVIRLLRLLAHAPLLFIEMTDDQREVVMRLVDDKTGLVCETGVTQEEFTIHLTDIGRLVLEAAIQPNTDALKDAVEMCWGFFDQCCQDQRNMVPNREAMRDMCRHALDAAKQGKGEGL